MNKIPAITGWVWLKEGVALFRKQPAALTTLLFANIVFIALLGMLPVVNVLRAVLFPSVSIAYMMACLMIENGERVTPGVLLTGFRKPALLPLCKIGLIYLVVFLLLTLLLNVAVDPAVFEMAAQADPKSPPPPGSLGGSLALLCILALNAAVLIALAFAAPLTYWQHMKLGKAVFYSFFAVVKNARVFIVLLMSWSGILMGAWMVSMLLLGNSKAGMIVMIWTGFLFMALLQCALYASYRHIFGKPVAATAKPVDLSK